MLRSRLIGPCLPIAIRYIARLASIGFAFTLAYTVAFALDRDRNITQFYYSFWSARDGAPSDISAFAQTEDGHLWIGSAGACSVLTVLNSRNTNRRPEQI